MRHQVGPEDPHARAPRRQNQRILDSVEELLRIRAFRELSVEDVMATAGMSRTTFYRILPRSRIDSPARLEAIAVEIREASKLWVETSAILTPLEESGVGLIEAYRRHGRLLLRAFNDAAATDPQVEEAWRISIDTFIDRATKRITGLNPPAGCTNVADPRQTARALVLMTERYLLQTFAVRATLPSNCRRDPARHLAGALRRCDHPIRPINTGPPGKRDR